jgi:hypothetical protein
VGAHTGSSESESSVVLLVQDVALDVPGSELQGAEAEVVDEDADGGRRLLVLGAPFRTGFDRVCNSTIQARVRTRMRGYLIRLKAPDLPSVLGTQ